MRRSMRTKLMIGAAVFAASACGSSESTSVVQNPVDNYHITAKIDGVAWAGNSTSVHLGALEAGPGVYSMLGSAPGSEIATLSLMVYDVAGPGTHSIAFNGPGTTGYLVLITQGSGSWSTTQPGSDGSVTITAISATHIAGTFHAVAIASTSSVTGTRTVTEGDFDVPIRQP